MVIQLIRWNIAWIGNKKYFSELQFFKKIYIVRYLYVPEDRQHDLLYCVQKFFFIGESLCCHSIDCWGNPMFSTFVNCPVGLGCRIHRLHLCRRVRTQPTWVSLIWHETSWCWESSDSRALGNAEHPFITIAPRSTLARRGSTW